MELAKDTMQSGILYIARHPAFKSIFWYSEEPSEATNETMRSFPRSTQSEAKFCT